MLKRIALSLTLAVTTTIGLPAQSGEPARTDAGDVACCGSTCPHCGCPLVPVCHCHCTTKMVTTYKYTGSCEEICVPGVTPLCKCCEDRCSIRDVRKLGEVPRDQRGAGPQMHGRMGLPELPLSRPVPAEYGSPGAHAAVDSSGCRHRSRQNK